MLKRDFIMVQIEELSKVIVQIITNRNSGATRKNQELINVVYNSLKVSNDYLMTTALEDILHFLDCEDGAGLYRMELAAKTLLEESHLDPKRKPALLHKAQELLQYIQQHDTTFSLERVELLDNIKQQLNK
ncbi:hypothetical protein DW095_01885 [Bacteroides sp. AM07-16]|nr:hypothetical protein DW095_01885 [Bacteroides sp. AM07-16]